MKAADIRVGEVYAVKVGGKVQPVRIVCCICDWQRGSDRWRWIGENQSTNREVRIKSAQRCLYRVLRCPGCRVWIRHDLIVGHFEECKDCQQE